MFFFYKVSSVDCEHGAWKLAAGTEVRLHGHEATQAVMAHRFGDGVLSGVVHKASESSSLPPNVK